MVKEKMKKHQTISGVSLKSVYTPEDVGNFNYEKQLGYLAIIRLPEA